MLGLLRRFRREMTLEKLFSHVMAALIVGFIAFLLLIATAHP